MSSRVTAHCLVARFGYKALYEKSRRVLVKSKKPHSMKPRFDERVVYG